MAKTKSQGKRPLSSSAQAGPVKKRKVEPTKNGKPARTVPKKEKASQRKTIPIPASNEVDSAESDVEDEDLEYFAEASSSVAFLNHLDQKGIARSKFESDRLHKLDKPVRKPVEDDLPSVNSHEDDHELWDSDIGDDINSDYSSQETDAESSVDIPRPKRAPSVDVEQDYETRPRISSKKETVKGSERLPVKLADGTIKKRGNLPAPTPPPESDSDSDEAPQPMHMPERTVEDVSTGARFGRPAVATVLGTKSRKARIEAAKEQLASICQEIVSDPENSLGLLRRLHSFALASITTQAQPQPVPNDPLIRKLAFLSQLAVFKDIIPGYRIRPLTDHEKSEKVSQMVQRTRDYEQGLVSVYQSYLQVLEGEVKSKSELSDAALHCMCTLLTEATHFNYRVNLMSAVVARLSKKSWDASSNLCLDTINAVLRQDNTGEASLEIVRLLNRMIKERRFNVHPNVLSCLRYLRLKSELGGVRASDHRSEKENEQDRKLRRKWDSKRRKGKPVKFDPKPHLSKNAKKAMKEVKEIEEEMHEAEAEVDHEERAKTHTETLKLLFVLYFRILKNPHPTPLLPAALEGISRFAHLVNIDFFKDLLAVLKSLILRNIPEVEQDEEDETEEGITVLEEAEQQRQRLMCIVTAFELLSGQGEALVIDLSDFVNFLYVIILELSLAPNMEDPPRTGRQSAHSTTPRKGADATMSDLLFRALSLVFTTRSSAGNSPPWRSAAFAKRLLTSAMYWPAATALRAIELVRTLLVKEPALDALLSTEDRVADGVYKPELDDPQLCNPFATSFWELRMLERRHGDKAVREAAAKLANFQR